MNQHKINKLNTIKEHIMIIYNMNTDINEQLDFFLREIDLEMTTIQLKMKSIQKLNKQSILNPFFFIDPKNQLFQQEEQLSQDDEAFLTLLQQHNQNIFLQNYQNNTIIINFHKIQKKELFVNFVNIIYSFIKVYIRPLVEKMKNRNLKKYLAYLNNTIGNLDDSSFSVKDLKNNVKKLSFYFTNIDIIQSKKIKINQNNNVIYNFVNQSKYKKYKSIYTKYDLLNISILSENYKLLYAIFYGIKMYSPKTLRIFIEKIIIDYNPNHYPFEELNKFQTIHKFKVESILKSFDLRIVIQERGFYRNKLYYERYITLNENGKHIIYLQKDLISNNKKQNTENVIYRLLNYQNKLKIDKPIVISSSDKLYERKQSTQKQTTQKQTTQKQSTQKK